MQLASVEQELFGQEHVEQELGGGGSSHNHSYAFDSRTMTSALIVADVIRENFVGPDGGNLMELVKWIWFCI